jgi:hypothetical protein
VVFCLPSLIAPAVAYLAKEQAKNSLPESGSFDGLSMLLHSSGSTAEASGLEASIAEDAALLSSALPDVGSASWAAYYAVVRIVLLVCVLIFSHYGFCWTKRTMCVGDCVVYMMIDSDRTFGPRGDGFFSLLWTVWRCVFADETVSVLETREE